MYKLKKKAYTYIGILHHEIISLLYILFIHYSGMNWLKEHHMINSQASCSSLTIIYLNHVTCTIV